MPPDGLTSNITGFQRWIDFIKATISLGLTLTAGLWAILTWGLDGRYYGAESGDALQAQVVENRNIGRGLQTAVEEIQTALANQDERQQQEVIFDTKLRQCNASGDAARYFERRVSNMSTEYRQRFGKSAYVPNCSDIE